MFWRRLREKWAARDQRLAVNELRREAAEESAPAVPHTGGALFDEPLQPQPIEEVPGDDLPAGPPES
jgi:hypothetical protein